MSQLKVGNYKCLNPYYRAEVVYSTPTRLDGWVHTIDGSYSERWEPDGKIAPIGEDDTDLVEWVSELDPDKTTFWFLEELE